MPSHSLICPSASFFLTSVIQLMIQYVDETRERNELLQPHFTYLRKMGAHSNALTFPHGRNQGLRFSLGPKMCHLEWERVSEAGEVKLFLFSPCFVV